MGRADGHGPRNMYYTSRRRIITGKLCVEKSGANESCNVDRVDANDVSWSRKEARENILNV